MAQAKKSHSPHFDSFALGLLPRGEWIKYWSLKFSLLSGSLLGKYWAQVMKPVMGETINPIVITSSKGVTECHLRVEDRKRFAQKQLELRVANNSVKAFCDVFNSLTDKLLTNISQLLVSGTITPATMKKFVAQYRTYFGYYVVPRHLIDFAEPTTAAAIIEDLRAARLRAEPAATESDKVLQKFMNGVAQKTGITTDALLCMTSNELDAYLDTETLPDKKILTKRLKGCGIIYTKTTETIITDPKQVKALSLLAVQATSKNEVKGTIAFKGITRGTVRIVFDPTKAKTFNKGDILITGMTRPEFVPIMKKAAAIVTDAGGMLCHAAIVARELKKPCIIGTQSATTIFKDGNTVEVDAEKGIVRLIDKK